MSRRIVLALAALLYAPGLLAQVPAPEAEIRRLFSTGSETVVPGGNLPRAGQTAVRRYTNIWMRQSGGWKLVARHANVVCP